MTKNDVYMPANILTRQVLIEKSSYLLVEPNYLLPNFGPQPFAVRNIYNRREFERILRSFKNRSLLSCDREIQYLSRGHLSYYVSIGRDEKGRWPKHIIRKDVCKILKKYV